MKVKKIVIKISKGETLELTLEEAKALRRTLDDVIGTKDFLPSSAPIIIKEPWRPYWDRLPYTYVITDDTSGVTQ